MRPDDIRGVDAVLREAVLPVVAACGAAVVDGGTDSGVMRAMGRARAVSGVHFPLVGVAAEGTVVAPGVTPLIDDAGQLEMHHTHIVLVPGTQWGDESSWIATVADVIASGKPSVTLLVNGGEIAYEDVSGSLERGRPLVVLAGTGRTADAIAAARRGVDSDPRAAEIACSKLTRIVHLHDIDDVRAALATALR
jgi:hypothetical protein